MYYLEKFVYGASKASDTVGLQKHWTEFVARFGAEGYRVTSYTPQIQERSEPFHDITYNTPPGWDGCYRKQIYHRYDSPLTDELREPGPFARAEAVARRRLPASKHLLVEIKEFGIPATGIFMNLWLGAGRKVSTGLYVPSGDAVLDNVAKHTLQAGLFVFCVCYRELRATPDDDEDPPVKLSPREQDVLRWIALGKTKREIADILGVSISSVKRHCENAFLKLGVNNLASAVARAMAHGLIDP